MTLIVHRSQRVEELVDALAAALRESAPADPFEAVPVVVGSRGMDRWLRHELATRLGGLARVDFVFPGTAFEGAARWLLGGAADPREAFWQPRAPEADGFRGPRLVARVLAALRAHLDAPELERVRGYLGPLGGAVGPRELAFAEEVAQALERLLYDRHVDALAWARDPSSAPEEHRFLAVVLRAIEAAVEPSPAAVRALVEDRVARRSAFTAVSRPLHVFGLTTLRPGDKRWLATLARVIDVRLYALAPSSEWWVELRTAAEQRRKLGTELGAGELEEILAAAARENALLAANGGPSRDLQAWLEERDYEDHASVAKRAEPATLLARVQAFVEAAGDNPPAGAWAAHAGCPSLEVHACHGALRQCEALRDELLRRFAADPTLEPRHVLVMTPDVATHAPLLAAVLARGGDGVPAIPIHVADLGLRATNPVADTLVALLALAEERVTASRLVDLLGAGPLRARFELDEEDVAALRALVVDSGIRWAWDAADRARHDQPALDQNTVRFGLERLALGVLMHDPGGLAVVPGREGSPLGPAVPLDVAGRDAAARFGKLADVCARLEAVRDRVASPAPAPVWRERLRHLLDELTEVDAEQAWLRVEVEEALDALFPDDLGEGLALDRAAVVARLSGAFDRPLRGDRPVTGAVTVCALEPMRSVPFRVIAILGLDDGAFPRPVRAPAWDPFATARAGEYDRRAIDRHLFLEALLCARDALLLFATGFEPKRGQEAPPSIVVSELLELVGRALGEEGARALRVAHPLQPWSEGAFASAGRLPFDGAWRAAAVALRAPERRPAGLAATAPDARWPAEENAARTLTAVEVARALAKPQRELLGKRLGLDLAREDEAIEDREPIVQSGLDAWSLRDRALAIVDEGEAPRVDALEARLRGEGVLALRSAGRRALEGAVRDAAAAKASAASVGGARREPVRVRVDVEGVAVTAVAADARDDGALRLVWTVANKEPGAMAKLVAWVTLLAGVAAGERVASAHVCGFGGATTLRAPAPAEACARLAELVRLARAARSAPILLFPKLSPDVARRLAKSRGAPPEEIVRACEAAWVDGGDHPGDLGDPWVAALFGHLGLDELEERAAEIVALAEAVWGPIEGSGGAKGGDEEGA